MEKDIVCYFEVFEVQNFVSHQILLQTIYFLPSVTNSFSKYFHQFDF